MRNLSSSPVPKGEVRRRPVKQFRSSHALDSFREIHRFETMGDTPPRSFDLKNRSCVAPEAVQLDAEPDAATPDAHVRRSEPICGRRPHNHRPASEECDREREPGSLFHTVDNPACSVDSDCTAGENGRCLNAQFQAVPICSYDMCFSDAMCTRGGPCACAPPKTTTNNICLAGNCNIDGECGPNGFCSPSFGMCGWYSGVVAYYCHTCEDECVDDSDCDHPDAYCAYEPRRARWECSSFSCVD
jgi:hypothetical protein